MGKFISCAVGNNRILPLSSLRIIGIPPKSQIKEVSA
jgi:hypothetical protein